MANTMDTERETVSMSGIGVSEPVPDRTETGKEHFEVLDGLRGTAAVLVVLFHIQGITVTWVGEKVILHHAPLAVDFFFALSGFVIGYAYDDRWKKMSIGQFLTLRLIRLHPLVILGVTMGLVSYLFDPFRGNLQNVPLGTLLGVFVLGLLLLPAGPIPNRWTDRTRSMGHAGACSKNISAILPMPWCCGTCRLVCCAASRLLQVLF